MIHAYDAIYVNQAMDTLGNMLDYAVTGCGMDLAASFGAFLQSGIATQFGTGHPKYVAGMSGKELAFAVARVMHAPIPSDKRLPLSERTPYFWTGWAMAYIQWYMGRDFQWLQDNGLDIASVLDAYSPLHEADLTVLISFAEHRIASASRNKKAPLHSIRENARLTQAELARRSGVSLRMIRAYEQKQQDLGKAEVRTVFNLSRVLGCKPDDLIP